MQFSVQASNASEKPAKSIFYTEDGDNMLLETLVVTIYKPFNA